MTERELLVDCLSRLNRADVAYMLTGSMASNYWGIPRSTHDQRYLRFWATQLKVAKVLDDLLEGKIRPKET